MKTRWRQVKELFARVASLPASKRTSALVESGADSRVRADVLALLEGDAAARLERFLDRPAYLPTEIAGHTLIEVIGRGGMGCVYRARPPSGGPDVALKTAAAPDERTVEGMRREIAGLSRLRHPGIVHVLASGVAGGIPWYAMELVAGQDLLGFLRTHGAVAALGTMCCLCDTLAYLHGEGLVHGDLKPANIIVRPDGSPVIVDFGLVSWFGVHDSFMLAQSLEVAGTAAYMAPELISGEPVDARADLYSLGCIIHELTTGQPPYAGDIDELLRQHLEAEPPTHDPLVRMLLAKDPRDRPGYAGDVARALGAMEAPPAAAAGIGPTGLARPKPYLYRPHLSGRAEIIAELEARLAGGPAFGAGGIVLLSGESGAGKTRLTLEVASRAARRGVRVLLGECTSERRALLEAFARPLRAVGDRCRALGIGESDRVIGERGGILRMFEPTLADLPGQARFGSPEALPPAAAQLRVVAAVADTIAAVAAGGATLLVLDDLQWADPSSLAILERLAASPPERLLILGTYRSDEAGESLRALDGAVVRVPLPRLTRDEVGAMVSDMLGIATADEHFVDFVHARTDGNPFFVAEQLHAALSAGVLARGDDGRWCVRPAVYDEIAGPPSLGELVLRRLADLDETSRRLLEIAAVLGRENDQRLLATLAARDGSGEASVEDALSRLRARHLLDDAERGAGRYRFSHERQRAAALEATNAERRRRLHRFAAEELEGREAAGVVAVHWQEAGEPAKARVRFLEAARDAAARGGLAVAEGFYRRYLALCEGHLDEEQVTARNELGVMLAAIGQPRAALVEHEAALAAALELERHDLGAASLERISFVHGVLGDTDASATALAAGLSLAREAGDAAAPAEAALINRLAGMHLGAGRLDAAEAAFRDALDRQRRLGNRRAEGVIINNLALIERDRGNLDRARAGLLDALEILRASGSRLAEGETLLHLAFIDWRRGALADAELGCRQALARYREIGYRRWLGIGSCVLGQILVERGDVAPAEAAFSEALAICREVGERAYQAESLTGLAGAHRRTGRLAEARAAIALAEAIVRELDSRRDLILVLCARGHIELVLGEGGAALVTAQEAASAIAALGFPPESRHGRELAELQRNIQISEIATVS